MDGDLFGDDVAKGFVPNQHCLHRGDWEQRQTEDEHENGQAKEFIHLFEPEICKLSDGDGGASRSVDERLQETTTGVSARLGFSFERLDGKPTLAETRERVITQHDERFDKHGQHAHGGQSSHEPRSSQTVTSRFHVQREEVQARFEEAKIELDAGRFEQEMIMLAQKVDVAEELDRLNAHVIETRNILKKGGAVGRRLDFMMQEFNRESNTLGSKSINTDITQSAVELKVLIEQMREQIQNIE